MKTTLQTNLSMLEAVATALGPLVQEVVFVGGAIVGLLLDDPASIQIRATVDVDLVVEALSSASYYKFGDRLKQRGFSEDSRPDAPFCRWFIGGISVDIVPTIAAPLGFSNRWYPVALKMPIAARLPSGKAINIISAPAFMATKLIALDNRGKDNLQGSHDMEDIVTLLDGRSSFEAELATADSDMRAYIIQQLRNLLERADVEEILVGHLGSDTASQGRLPILLQRMRRTTRWEP